jgi:hypothetical protein
VQSGNAQVFNRGLITHLSRTDPDTGEQTKYATHYATPQRHKSKWRYALWHGTAA